MLDPHRVLIDEMDRLENLAQIRALLAAGYMGPFSFEPFANEVHARPDPMTAAKESMDFVPEVALSDPPTGGASRKRDRKRMLSEKMTKPSWM